MSKIEGMFKMRFKCTSEGKLLKGAPGNFKCGQVYMQPFRMSRFPFWELVEPTPELKVPPPLKGDSVFEDVVFVPDEDVAPIEMQPQPTIPDEPKINPDDPAIIEPYAKWSPYTGRITPIPEKPAEPKKRELTRDELKAILDEKGVKYLKNAKTATLAKMVEGLEKNP